MNGRGPVRFSVLEDPAAACPEVRGEAEKDLENPGDTDHRQRFAKRRVGEFCVESLES